MRLGFYHNHYLFNVSCHSRLVFHFRQRRTRLWRAGMTVYFGGWFMAGFTKVCKKSEIPEDTGKKVEVHGMEIALFKADGKVRAIHAVCPHQGGPMDEGGIQGSNVMCPWHGWEFDVTTGKCTFNDSIKIATFPVKEDGEDVYVQV